MESLGLMEAGGSTKSEVRLRGATGEKLGAKEEALLAQRSKGRGTSAARAKVGWKDRAAGAKGVVSTGGNAVIAALAVRGAGGKGAGAVVVAGVKDPQDELREAFQLCMDSFVNTMLVDELREAFQLCMDSFVNTMLVVGGEGETTFRDICVLFKRHYPILSTVNNTLFTEAGLGRRVAEWYDKKTGQKITRIEKASNNLPRSHSRLEDGVF
ncbi:hypothetical protein T484DRAFT_1844492 [Baffinella frigidus]|nr:hypothetical protein T484DRAFT_1844492 [Cryptophyta sp. CCMP2293]